MPTTILLIENDAAFAREITEALEGAGYRVRVTGDGKEGLELARELLPAAIVLCVELPKMSGYSICQKLKKDDALRGIPLVLTSAEATAETFEGHKKLKTRAETYLHKPYTPADLLAALAPYTGMPEAPAGAPAEGEPSEEEVVSLEEELGLEMVTGEAEGELPALDLASLPDEPAPGGDGGAISAGGEDEDLRLLDDAFAGLSAPPAAPAPRPSEADEGAALDAGADLDLALEGERPVAAEEIDAAADSLPPEDEAPAGSRLDALAEEADLALGSLGADESPAAALDALDALEGPPEAPPPAPPLDLAPELAAAFDLEPEPRAQQVRGASADALRAAGIALLDETPSAPPSLKVVPPLPATAPAVGGAELGRLEAELADLRAALAARDAELRDLQDRLSGQTHRADEAAAALATREADAAAAAARADAVAGQLRRAEAELKAGREEARKAADQARAAEDRARTAEAQTAAATARAEAAEARAAAAAEKQRAAEAQAGTAEARVAAATAEAARHRSAAAEATRGLEAKAAELAAAAAAAARLEGVERELEELKTELIVAQGEVEGARSEVENRTAELKKRIAELETANAKNEERVVKAYLKIKGDEKVRDKARKAIAIALQLLEEGLPPEQAGGPRPPGAGAKLE